MIQTGFESRVKVQQIIDSQLPEFILDESPKAADFLKQYYVSQEYQGAPIDIVENLDQYLKLDNLTPEVVVGFTTLSSGISSTATTIQVATTKGFPQNYGLFKIDDEIITYTGLTTNTFTGCIRGFSGITSYHQDLKSEELVFSTSKKASHVGLSTVQNLSSLFLQEFYKKVKYSLTPDLENKNFVSDLNVGNFIKEARTLYESKGTEESYRILFNVLFGETPKVIDLEQFLAKPSSATYVRRAVVVADAISGDPLKLEGQTIFKNNDTTTSASVSEVEVIRRKNKTYYKLLLFIGYDDAFPAITGSFEITGSSKNLDYVSVGSSVISVDSTIGFPKSGKIYSGDNEITYTSKSINQFFGCSGVTSGIATASTIRSDETYYGYEDGNTTKRVELRITGVLSDYKPIVTDSSIFVGDQIKVKNVGQIIENPTSDKSYKQIFANSWIYNTSSRFQIDSFGSGSISQVTLKTDIDKSSLKVGDYIDVLAGGSQTIVASNLRVTGISGKQVTTDQSFSLSSGLNYDIRRKIKNASSSSVALEFTPTTADVQNVYNDNDEYMYVASNSLPSYQITQPIFSYDASGVSGQNSTTGLYSIITFSSPVSFITGSEIYYTPSNSPISGLAEGVYYAEVLSGNLEIKIYASRSVIGTSDYLTFGSLTSGTHNFVLNSQKEKVLSPQKILRKFPLSVNIGDGQSDLTTPGSVGMLINGVEVLSYKTNDKVYYGPLKSVGVLNGGSGYDVINPPLLSLSSGSALVQPVVSGSVEKIYVDPQEFDIDVIVSVALTGGNGSGTSFEPVIQRKRREIEFDARQLTDGGGVDITNETITFLSQHNLVGGQQVVYRPGSNPSLGIGTFNGSNTSSGNTLEDESIYFVKYISDTTIQLYQSLSDYRSGINTVGFTTIGTAGIQKFATEPKNTLSEIKIINGGSGYTNRKLRVSSSGISTTNHYISFTNHGFNDGELVTYASTGNLISGLSTSNQYYVLKVDSNSFRLSDAGIGGTIRTNYERRKYVELNSTGSGYHIFNYPEISLQVQYSSVGLGSTQFRGSIAATPVVRGKITDVYVYSEGSDYGSTILNYHKKPTISIKNGKNAQFKPIIINGRIEDVSVQYSGTEYYSTPDIKVSGVGTGAILRPVVVNNKITDVIVVNAGAGYSTADTTIIPVSAGKNAIFNPQVRDLSVNNNVLYNIVSAGTTAANEIISSSYSNLQYAIAGYSQIVQTEFGDTGASHSPIIGWAYDGNPIYGSYGYSDPKDENSSLKKLVSGYTLNSANVSNRPSEFSSGFFLEDYTFTNSGDLDEYNGRFCVTPEFPNGVYAYFATSIVDLQNNVVGSFPYFIGDRYRSKLISENKKLDQTFDFNNSNLIRNTFPYKVNNEYADNDFIIESNEVINQVTVVESVSSGYIDEFEIINAGSDYKVGDNLQFDESNTGGGGLVAEVSEVKGKEVVDLQTTTTSYNDVIFTWKDGNQIQVKVNPQHNLQNLDYVNVSGFSTELSSLNGFNQIGVTSYSSSLTKDIPAYSVAGVVTDIYVSNIPENISIGSSIKIESETLSVLNIFSTQNVVRVVRETTGSAHTATSTVNFIPDTFTINKSVDYFESKINDLVYFNPNQSVGVGTTSGVGIAVTNNVGVQTNNIISIPTQSIYLPNHPFRTNQAVTFTKPSSASVISVANTSGSTAFNLPSSGNSQTVYIIKKSVDYIGIVTQIGLTTTTSGLFFINNGSNDYQYSLQSNFTQVKGDIEKIVTQVSVSTSHELTSGDTINLSVKPNLSVGIGTSTAVRVKRNTILDSIVINTIEVSSSGINTITQEITIPSHEFNTGDKVVYVRNSITEKEANKVYYVYKVDKNTIKLCETLVDAFSVPPVVVDISLIASIVTFGSLSGVSKWSGGVLAPNGKIYGIPFGASQVLEIDPVGLTTSTFGSLGNSGGKWAEGVLAPNGKIYGIPFGASQVLEIDPVGLTTSTFGSLGIGPKWAGGVLAPNGKIYGIPYNASQVLEIDPVGLTTSTFGSLGSSGAKWSGGVLAPNGKIYGIPFTETKVLVIDPVGLTTSTFGSLESSIKWSGGVLAPNGKIYGIPYNASQVLVIDPEGNSGVGSTSTFGSVSGSLNWFGGVLAPNNKIYGIPSDASQVLVIDPLGDAKEIQNINPAIPSIKNNNLVFDLTDSSLSGYNFKIFYDQDFKDEFVSTGSTSTFSVSGVGTVGVSTNASLTINYSEGLPTQLFYTLEKSGYISTADKEVQNYSQINFIDSYYNGSYNISGVGTTTFSISLTKSPEKNSYTQSDCDTLEYTTTSTTASGGVSKVTATSPGINFKKLPIFEGIDSISGTGVYIVPKSNTIGKINEIRIVNEGFEYASDKTLRPEASVPKFATIKNSNTISNISISNGGKNYISSPDLIIVDSDTGEKINSGLLIANLDSSSIRSVTIDAAPFGLPDTIVTIRAINNTNGVGIQTVQSSSSGIVTCILVTPLAGFTTEPFAVGDKIFVEGIQKYGTEGDGLNSEDYGYDFFTVSSYTNGGTLLPRQLQFNLSGLTTNPGIAKTVENFYGRIINYNNYPKFVVIQSFSNFIVGEALEVQTEVGFIKQDLTINESNQNYLKISGTYDLQSNQIIRGSQSGSVATVNSVKMSSGQFNIGYASTQRIGWSDDIGKLNNDTQVISDNDYYQNLSYSIKSNQEWSDIVSPVNGLLHPSGLKNFSDTQITENVGVGTIAVQEYVYSFYDIKNENRVDTINNFDLVLDVDTLGDTSKFLKFKNKKLADYIECRTNRVLDIDDISSQFSSSDQISDLDTSSRIVDILPSRKYNKYLVQISNKDYSQRQFTEIIVLNNESDVFTLEKGTINTGASSEIGYVSNLIGDVYGHVDEFQNYYLKFEPRDAYNTTYNIKYLNTTFSNFTSGVGTTSIGFVSLTGITSTVFSGSTSTLLQTPTSVLKSVHSEIHIIDNVTDEMNYVEIFVDHDGTNTNIAELYFDDEDGLSSNFIGSFGASISGGILTLNYTNTSSNSIIIRTKNVGFGSTASGIGTYRFKQSGQVDGFENTVNYNSNYSNISSASTITSFNSSTYTSLKSTVRVGLGQTSALHQVMLVVDSSNVYTTQYPFLSIGSTSGIGTFGGELVGSTVSLKFYPDSSISGTFEVLSFNEIFFKENDYINVAPTLEYNNILESVGVSKYYAINDDELNKLNFELNHQGTPIFMKTFDPSNSSVLNTETGTFSIQNHFFSTGEELIYRPNSTFIGVAASSVGIGSTLNYVGVVTNILPPTVYAIKVDNNNFKLATRKEYANAGISVTFTSTGSGNAHELEMVKKNEKSIITIDNVIQSPIAYSLLTYTVNNGGQIGTASTIFGLSGISSIIIGDILKIDNEYMNVVNVGLGTTYSGPISFAGTFPLVNVQRGFVGSSVTTHSNSGIASVYRGSFNIEKSNIYFTQPPLGSLEDQLFVDSDELLEAKSYFNGRVFLRKDYTTNQVYDNISETFTGIGQTYRLTVGGANTVGLGTSGGNGIVLINGIFQTPTTENNANNNFRIIENSTSGISSVVFSGITSTNGSIVISESDVNMNQLPRGGVIVSLGSTAGLGYAPLVGASVTAIVSGGSITSIGIGTTGNWGSGYRSPVSVAVTETGHSGTAATITALVGAGGTLSFTIVGGGSGYVKPTINISPPNYNNLSVTGVSRLGVGSTTACGTGLLLNVSVGARSTTGIGSTLFEVTGFNITRNGYGFKPGDVIKAVGLVTAYGLAQPLSEFQLTVLETFNDSFSSWQFGQLDYIDSIKNLQDGNRTRFPLYYNSQLLSFERNANDVDSQLIDFNQLLIIFINGILQQPGIAYEFTGGTSFTFTQAPKVEDNVAIYFYRGSSTDSSSVDTFETIKPGDDLQVFSNNGNLGITTTQDLRVISDITSSDKVKTSLYTGQGIDQTIQKPVYWTKQKVDKVIDGELISKARDSIEPQIYPTAKIIRDITESSSEIFVDNVAFFNYEGESSIDFDAIIVSGAADPVSAAVTAIVSATGTIQSLSVNNVGSGYITSPVNVSISAPSRTGVGIGTIASATIAVQNGSLTQNSGTTLGENISGLSIVSNLSNTSYAIVGAAITGPGIPNNTKIVSVGSTYKYFSGVLSEYVTQSIYTGVNTSILTLGESIYAVRPDLASNPANWYTGTIVSIGINSITTSTVPGWIIADPSGSPDYLYSSSLAPGLTLSNVSTGTTIRGTFYISPIAISNPGFGYTSSNPPQVLVPLPDPIYENITSVTGIAGTFGNITGIGTTVGIGTNLAIKFTLSSVSGLSVGYPIYIYNTIVGNGVTSIISTNSDIVGVGTTCLDNIYYISGIDAGVGIITCNIHSQSSTVGLATTGSIVGNFSWGRMSGFSRASSPISIGVSGFTVNSGLTTFPTIQRRGYGLRNIGPIKKTL